ncbi:MAG TPA: hypothetical protein VMH87_17215, partial [Pseudomonadales bacterium]|nr:hypothetical protein [Pseudomonadales bacterium]
MNETTTPTARVAKHGEKMIEVRVRFWTDGITGNKDTVIPKHAWDSGMVSMERNEVHGIKPASWQPFNSILDLQSVIAKVLIEHEVTLHTNRKSRKLLKPERT